MEQKYKMNLTAGYNADIARAYGINEALLLDQIEFYSRMTPREDGFCWFTSAEFEMKTAVKEKAMVRAIKNLVDRGIIEVKNTYIINTMKRSRHFRIIGRAGQECSNLEFQNQSKRPLLEEVKTTTSEPVKTTTSLYNSNNISNKTIKESVDSNELKFIHSEICKLFNKSESRYKLSDKRKQKLKSRLKDLGKEGILQACEAITRSEFHMGENQRNWIAEPYWVLENFERAEKWAGEYQNNNKYADLTKLEF